MAKNIINVQEQIDKNLNEFISKLKTIDSEILKISQSARNGGKEFFSTKSPNELNAKLIKNRELVEKLNLELENQRKVQLKLEQSVKRLSNVRAQSNKKTSEEIVNQRILRQNADAQVLATSKLASEYQKLVAKMNLAGKSVQNLTAKQAQGIRLSNKEQAELKQSSKEFATYQKSVLKADKSIGRFQRNVGNYQSALGKATLAFRNFAGVFGVFSAGLIAQDIFETVKELDGLDKALKQVTETTEEYAQAQSFLNSLSEEAGVQIEGLQRSYTKFLASAKTTNLTIAETQDIFRQTAKAGAVLGLSTDDINGSFRALEQILSKGKVQAEEIRGQLGERLPGAFQILAKSMGLTTQELDKQLSLGNVISEEVLPNFAKELEKTFGLDAVNKVNTLTASQNRLGNAWTEFIRSLDGSEGTLTKIFSFVIDGIGQIVKGITLLNTTTEQYNESLKNDIASETYNEIKQQLSDAGEYAEKLAITEADRARDNKERVEEEIRLLENRNKLIFDTRNNRDGTRVGNATELSKNKDEIENLTRSLGYYNGVLKATEEYLEDTSDQFLEQNKLLDENTDATDKNNDSKSKTKAILEGSIKAHEQVISTLKDEQSRLAVNGREWQNYEDDIKDAEQALADFKIEIEGLDLSGFDTDSFEDAAEKIQSILTQDKTIEGLDYDTPLNEITEFFKRKDEERKKDFEKDKETAEMRRELESELYSELANFTNMLFDAKIQRYDDDIQRNSDRYAVLLDNENLSIQQREALEAERDRKEAALEKKKRAEQRKQAIFNKVLSLAQITINTVESASKAASAAPPPANIPLIALAVALGAAQAATVIATPIPQYAKGKGDYDNYEGDAIWGEKKREVKISKDGSIEISPRKIGNHLTHVKKDDIIHPDANKFFNDEIGKYAIYASMNSQNSSLDSFIIAQSYEKALKEQTDRMISTMERKNTKINLHNNNTISDDLKFLFTKQNTL